MPRKPPPQSSAPLTRAAIYVRVSTEDQARDGFGLEVQRQRCSAMATVKGWSLIDTYADEGVSGAKGIDQRPGLARLMADALDGRIDAIIVLALDRLGRKTRIVLELVEQLGAANVVLVSVKESLDTSTPQGQFVLTMFAALAQLERDMIAQRLGDGRNVRSSIDGERGGALPYGYIRSEDGPQIETAEAETVRYILRNKRGGKSFHQIARDLNERGTPGPRGGKWYARTVKIVCDNRAIYKGGQRGESATSWPAII